MALSEKLRAELEELASHYPQRRAALIPALHRCQEEHGGWISPELMEACAELFGIEPVEVWGVVSFYPMFRTRPCGTHLINVCHNISCELRGAQEILAKVCELTGADPGETSSDGRFTVGSVECQGACANAPMMEIDGTYHEDLDEDKVERILGGLR